jgi:hypothetical protein
MIIFEHMVIWSMGNMAYIKLLEYILAMWDCGLWTNEVYRLRIKGFEFSILEFSF